MTKYNVSPLVAREIEFSTGTIFGGSWCRYFISITLHQCYIEATWKTRPKNDLDGNKEIFNSLQEYLDWFANLKKTNPEYIQTLKDAVTASYKAELQAIKPSSTEEEEQLNIELKDIVFLILFGPFYNYFVSEYVVSDTIWEEQDKLIGDLYYYFKS